MHRKTLQKILEHSEPPDYRLQQPRPQKKLGPYLERIKQIMKDDQAMPRKQRIEELKHDLAADGFCLQPFFATESAFLAVLFTFNL